MSESPDDFAEWKGSWGEFFKPGDDEVAPYLPDGGEGFPDFEMKRTM